MKDNEFSKMLKTIKPDLRIDYKSRCKVLEEDLKALSNKFRKQCVKNNKINKEFDEYRRKGINKIAKKINHDHSVNQKMSITVLRERLTNAEVSRTFLIKRVKEKYGAQVYLDLINTIDNPGKRVDVDSYKKSIGLK